MAILFLALSRWRCHSPPHVKLETCVAFRGTKKELRSDGRKEGSRDEGGTAGLILKCTEINIF